MLCSLNYCRFFKVWTNYIINHHFVRDNNSNRHAVCLYSNKIVNNVLTRRTSQCPWLTESSHSFSFIFLYYASMQPTRGQTQQIHIEKKEIFNIKFTNKDVNNFVVMQAIIYRLISVSLMKTFLILYKS